MCRPLVIFCVYGLWLASGHCNTLIWHPQNYVPVVGNTLAWIIPPQLEVQAPLLGPPAEGDYQNQSPTPSAGGCGHPSLVRRHSRDQLELPNEFLVAPSDSSQRAASPPVFLQLDPTVSQFHKQYLPSDICQEHSMEQANRDGAPCTEPRPTVQQQQQSADRRSPFSWPGPHYGGFGLLFAVPESATHLPTEQLIRQQLDLHRTQLPFDVSMNCVDSTSGCLGVAVKPPTTATTFNGEHVENVENVNYASPPLVKNVNNSNGSGSGSQQRREWRSIGELLAQQQQQQQHRQLSMLPL